MSYHKTIFIRTKSFFQKYILRHFLKAGTYIYGMFIPQSESPTGKLLSANSSVMGKR